MSEAFGQVQGPDIRQEAGSEDLHPYKALSVNPGIGSGDINEVKAVCDPAAVLMFYFNALAIPIAPMDNPYWKALQVQFLKINRCYTFWNDQLTPPRLDFINFGSEDWPLARLKPTKKNADDLVGFVRNTWVLRQYNTCYLDDANDDFPQWVKNLLGSTYTPDMPMKHQAYINRVIEGLAESVDFGGGRLHVVANRAKSGSHPSCSAITIECSAPGRAGHMTREESLPICKEQNAIGRGGRMNILWNVEGDDASGALGGYWRA
jgi:hypothetical protein